MILVFTVILLHKIILINRYPFSGDEAFSYFTFVENAVQANIKALLTENSEAVNQVYNIAVGEKFSVNYLYQDEVNPGSYTYKNWYNKYF